MNPKSILRRTSWELIGIVNSAFLGVTNTFAVSTPPSWPVQVVLFYGATEAQQWLYFPQENDSVQITSSFTTLGWLNHNIGGSGTFHPYGATGTASAGSSTTLTTTTTINRDLTGMGLKVRFTGGTGAGQEVTIASNTRGANSVLTLTGVTVTPDNTTTYQLLTGRFWVYVQGNVGSINHTGYYDFAADAWTAKTVTGPVAGAWGANGYLETTCGSKWSSNGVASGTATSGGATTLTNSGKSWASNQWTYYQVRLTGGTGAGQIRTVLSNTGTALTVNAAWGTNPDATSTYVIEGNDDWFFLTGNSAITLYRYAINGIASLSNDAQATGDTWVTMAPAGVRTLTLTTGSFLHYATANTSANFTNESAILNGRRLYSAVGSSSQSTIDYYDIPTRTWTNGATYGFQPPPSLGPFSQGNAVANTADGVWVFFGTGTLNRFNKFDPGPNMFSGGPMLPIIEASTPVADLAWISRFTDGGSSVDYFYKIRHGSPQGEMYRIRIT